MRTIELAGGAALPALGLGTWKAAPGEVGGAVREALRLGWRHLDCAPIYGNEAAVGAALAEALAAGTVRRDELWVTSKLWNDRHAPEDVVPALRETLADLRLDHLDLFLVHWPVAHRKGVVAAERAADQIGPDELPLAATWEGMQAAVDAGLCRAIGVSNCSVRKLEELRRGARIAPAVNQVELHPYLAQPGLVARCRELGVAVTAYSPLGSGDRPPRMRARDEPVLLADPVVRAVAERAGATPAQVLIAWALQRGTAVVPKAVRPAHLREDLAAGELELAAEDVAALDALDRGRRYVTGAFWELPGGPYTRASLWDE